MKSLDIIPRALETTGIPYSHYYALNQGDAYIVWAEDSQAGEVWANNHMQEQIIEGTIDYFTKLENDINAGNIQTALDYAGISYRLNAIQFERETNYIHYEWVWRI